MPMMELATTWLVDTGAPANEADRMTAAEVSWESSACSGRTLYTAKPSVRTMRQPPERMPRVIAVAQASITHSGTSKAGMKPPSTSTRVRMPMLFCASLAPCEKASPAVVTNCAPRRRRFSAGRAARNSRPSRRWMR